MILGNSDPGDTTSKTLNMLKRLRRLDGTALISSGVLTHSDIPNSTGESAAEFARECTNLIDQYVENGKDVEQILLSFDGGNVMLFNRSPAILALFFNDLTTVDSVERAGSQFLTQFEVGLGIHKSQPQRSSTAVENRTSTAVSAQITGNPKIISSNDEWTGFSSKIQTLFSKVVGSAQSAKIIQRELSAMGIKEGEFLMKNQFRSFGLKLTQRVKDKSIRKQLELELIDFLSENE